ncbi:MAG TPA: hypothetical protein VI895_15115 [Bdellovibrionota bacterium]|nr:hypothetical protein [Bdellovibrionota bacterium]
MCKKEDCPIYSTCDKEYDQALYCRKVELLLHLSQIQKKPRPRVNYVKAPERRILM